MVIKEDFYVNNKLALGAFREDLSIKNAIKIHESRVYMHRLKYGILWERDVVVMVNFA